MPWFLCASRANATAANAHDAYISRIRCESQQSYSADAHDAHSGDVVPRFYVRVAPMPRQLMLMMRGACVSRVPCRCCEDSSECLVVPGLQALQKEEY